MTMMAWKKSFLSLLHISVKLIFQVQWKSYQNRIETQWMGSKTFDQLCPKSSL